ncbi:MULTISPECIES: PRC-barrel domain-containing protein [unclassified Streptomyces]|uniref:PRC-barrel domain-containing protein n=1 Tax=unclassified Streptomyces TaxID=2593676 RepID=UPI001F5BB673|nr:PRC-barrel domain-containing protein [Streptomyces sp. HSG2]
MLFSEAHGRAVMDLGTAETVGTVSACTVTPSPARVAGFRLKTRGRGHHTLEWEDIESFGSDEVAVDGPARIRDEKGIEPDRPSHAVHDPLGKPVLTESGARHGTVVDVEFDEKSGRVGHLLTAEGQISGEELLGVGSYAVVVADR